MKQKNDYVQVFLEHYNNLSDKVILETTDTNHDKKIDVVRITENLKNLSKKYDVGLEQIVIDYNRIDLHLREKKPEYTLQERHKEVNIRLENLYKALFGG